MKDPGAAPSTRLINGLQRPRTSGVSGQPPPFSPRNGRHPQGGIAAYQISMAERRAISHLPRPCSSVGAAGMGCERQSSIAEREHLQYLRRDELMQQGCRCWCLRCAALLPPTRIASMLSHPICMDRSGCPVPNARMASSPTSTTNGCSGWRLGTASQDVTSASGSEHRIRAMPAYGRPGWRWCSPSAPGPGGCHGCSLRAG